MNQRTIYFSTTLQVSSLTLPPDYEDLLFMIFTLDLLFVANRGILLVHNVRSN